MRRRLERAAADRQALGRALNAREGLAPKARRALWRAALVTASRAVGLPPAFVEGFLLRRTGAASLSAWDRECARIRHAQWIAHRADPLFDPLVYAIDPDHIEAVEIEVEALALERPPPDDGADPITGWL